MAEPESSSTDSASTSQAQPEPDSTARPISPPRRSAMAFWTYLTIFVALLSLFLSPFLSHWDQHSWFLSLPPSLQAHFSRGRLVKIHPSHHHGPFRVFAADSVPDSEFSETVLVIPGLACNSFSFRHVLSGLRAAGVRAVAVDPPGSGFSERPRVLNGIEDVFTQIQENGIFWAFDRMVETGHAPYEERRARGNLSPYGAVEIGYAIKEVVREMRLGPVHLVIHDSMLPAGANFAASYPSLVRSVTLLDSSAALPAFPSWSLGVPVAGRLILKSPSVFFKLMRLCCSRSIDVSSVESQRLLLLGKDGRKGVLDMAKALNHSFDLREWKGSDRMKDTPFQMLWSNNWSDRWIDEGKLAAAAVPEGKFVYHSGGRWPQEDNAMEITERIVEFVTSLPKTIREEIHEPSEEHSEGAFERNGNNLHQHHYDHMPGNPFGQNLGMYGLGPGWMG